MRFKGGDLANRAVAVDPLEGVSHYLVGADRERWRTGVPHYARVECRDIYPGVSLVLRGNGRRLVYDLVIAPHADPGRIELELDGGEQVSQGPDGEILVHTARGRIRHSIPFAYQEGAGGRHQVPASLIRRGRSGVTYAIAGYDRSHPLVIDPEISYVTTLGGPDSDVAFGVTGDGLGNAYLAGITSSAGYPTTPGSYQSERDRPGYLAFVTKLSPEGAVLFSTYLGGSVSDGAFEITLDSGGRIAVAGTTSSADFPIVSGFQGTYLAGLGQSGFVAMLSADGAALVYSSFLGGTGESGFGDDVVQAIAADAAGQVYLGGVTNSADFPTRGAAQPATGGFYDAFVMKINADLVGPDSLLYSTYLGGTNTDEVLAMAVDSAGTIHVGGQTGSLDFPTDRPTIRPLQDRSGGGTDGFVARIDPALAPSEQILYSTYIGGEARDRVLGLALDPQGPVYAVGATLSTRFPVTPGARPDPDYTPSPLRNFSDCFFVKLDPRIGGSEGLLYSTYLGGQRADEAAAVAVDNGGNIYIGGTSASPDFPAGRGSTLPGPFVLAWRSSLEPSWEWAPPTQTAYQQVRGMAVTGDGTVYLVGESSPTQQFGGEDVLAIRLAPPQQGRLQILTTTTRWRPQKAYTKGPDGNPLVSDPLQPINVVFEGPADLDITTISFQVTPPGGSDSYEPSLGEKREHTIEGQTPPDGKEFFLVEWKGPWKLGTQYLPIGDYGLKVTAKRRDSQAVLESTVYQKVSLVEVTGVEVFPCGESGVSCTTGAAVPALNQRSDGFAMPGAGLAVFPDAKGPGLDFQRAVLVKATTTPALEPAAGQVAVHFRVVDVDDPSAGIGAQGQPVNHPVDDDSQGREDDNRDASGWWMQTQAKTDAFPDSSGIAWAEFHVGVRQGDNYKIVASTDSTWLEEIKPVVPSEWAELKHDTEQWDGWSNVSPMVTVWRTLHVELDRMDPGAAGVTQEALDRDGTWTEIGRTWRSWPPFADGRVLRDDDAQFIEVPTEPGQEVEHPREDDWKGGVVDPFANGGLACEEQCSQPPCNLPVPPCYRVTRNSDTKLVVESGNLKDEANAEDRSYYLRDDHLRGLTDAPHDLSLLRRVLDNVYIRVEESPRAEPLVVWRRHFTRERLERLAATIPSPPNAAHWTTRLILGFEDAVELDHDPTNERPSGVAYASPTLGRAEGGYSPIGIVYAEAIRDFVTSATSCIAPTITLEEFLPATQAHELLHTLKLQDEGDETGGLMCSGIKNFQNQPNRFRITDRQMAELRAVEKPWVGFRSTQGCPPPPSCQ